MQVNSSLIDSFTLTAVKMVSMCSNFGPHAASQLTDALASDSPYGDAGTKAIVTAIESRLNSMTGLTRGQQQKGGSQSQLLKCWWNYLTVSDWDFIKDTKQHFSAKLTRMVERANLLGLVSFDEHTYKWMLAVVLVAHYDQLPASADVFSKLQELKRVRAMERNLIHTNSLLNTQLRQTICVTPCTPMLTPPKNPSPSRFQASTSLR